MTAPGVFLFIAIVVTACTTSPLNGPTSQSPSQLIVGVPEANLPGAELGVGQFANLLSYEGLTNYGADGRPRSRLAADWRWENEDRRLRVSLRPNVVAHNGHPLTAAIAADLVRRAVTHPRNIARYPSFADIVAVRPEGDLQLVLELNRPSAMLLEDLTVPLDIGAEGAGTGAYRVVKRERDELILERWDKYYRGQPSLGRIVVRTFDKLRTSWASLLRGELDLVYDVPADAVEFIRNEDVQVVTVPRWYQFVIAFNSRTPALRSPLVRKALNLAINRASLVEQVLQGHGTPSTGALWPGYWAYDSSVAGYSFDAVEASSLLDDAGLRATLPSPDSRRPPARLRFTCLLPQNFTVWERIALEVQRDLFNIGVDMQLKVVPFGEFNQAIADGRFDATFLDMISGPSPVRASIFWRSAREFKGQYNTFGYENDDAERLFQVLRTSTNEAAVRSATRRLQRVMIEDPPAMFIAWNQRARAIRRDITIPDSDDNDVIWTLWRWRRASPVFSARAQ